MSNELTTFDQQFLLSDTHWSALSKQCNVLIKSGLLPKAISTVEKCVSVVLMGRELGLAPMTALNNISVINGKPTLEAKLMLALVFRKYPNAHYRIIKNDSQIAEVEMGRTKETSAKFSFTIVQAQQAGLTNKDSWKNYAADMLVWRAVSRACRMTFPEVFTVTSHTPDEIETIDVNVRQAQTEVKEEKEIMEKVPEIEQEILSPAEKLIKDMIGDK